MAFVVAVVVLIGVLAVAAYFVFRLQSVPSKHEVAKEVDTDEWARAIMEALPEESRERLGSSGAARVVSYVLDCMKMSGAVANGDDGEISPTRAVVLGGATSVEYVLERAAAAGLELTSREALIAVEASVEYLARIGAIGPHVS